jgi:hypothetical protein
MVPVTHSGIKIRRYLEWLVVRREDHGLFHDPAFCDQRGNEIESGVYEGLILEVLHARTRIGRGNNLRTITSCWKVLTSMSATESFDLSTEAPSLERKRLEFRNPMSIELGPCRKVGRLVGR